MHIPDGFLDPGVAAATAIVSAGAVGYALRRADRELDDERVPLLGVTAAFIFAVQMLNFPVAGGTSGHLLGAGLAAILLGPWLACLVIAVVLTAQALVFADGGISALGANVLNMGVIGALTVGYLMVGRRHLPRTRAGFLAVVAGGAWLAVMAGAAATAVELRPPAPCRWGRCSRRCSASTRSSASARRSSRWRRSAPCSRRGPTRRGRLARDAPTRSGRRVAGRGRVMSRAVSFGCSSPSASRSRSASRLRVAFRVVVARRPRSRRGGQGLRRRRRARASRSARRSPATPSRASRMSGSPRGWPGSRARSACSRSAPAPRTPCGAGGPRCEGWGRGQRGLGGGSAATPWSSRGRRAIWPARSTASTRGRRSSG